MYKVVGKRGSTHSPPATPPANSDLAIAATVTGGLPSSMVPILNV